MEKFGADGHRLDILSLVAVFPEHNDGGVRLAALRLVETHELHIGGVARVVVGE